MNPTLLLSVGISLAYLALGFRALRENSHNWIHQGFALGCFVLGAVEQLLPRALGRVPALVALVVVLGLWTVVSKSKVQHLNDDLERRIEARTRDLLESNQALAAEIAERQSIEAALRKKSQFEELISVISTKFISMPPEVIGEGITQALQDVGTFLGVDRACVYLLSEDRESVSTIYEWLREGLPQSSFHSSEAFTGWHTRIQSSLRIQVLQRSEITDEEDQHFIEALGAQSLVMLPILPLGAVLFESQREEHLWNEDLLVMLRMFAQILTGALERKRFEQRLNHLAYHDALTGLPNRLLLQDRLQYSCFRAERTQESVAVMVLDLDRFKEINDVLGHDVGDRLLVQVSERMLDCVRPSDTVARSGGDEFILVFPDIKEDWDVDTLAHRILEAFAEPFQIEGQEIHSTPSIGVSVFPKDGDSPELLLKNADIAMFRAKSQGRNNHQFYTPTMSDLVARRRSLEYGLRKAIEREEFLLHYQPQIESQSVRIVGIEALVRWQHPEKGMVPPMQFIPLAEETGLIVPIGEWVLEKACNQNKVWQEMGFDPMRVAINLSARQFHHSHQQSILDTVTRVLNKTRLDPNCLELEITESIAMQDLDATVAILERLHGIGVKLSIDDFGTGHSSLSYLKKFPIQALKIDRSFVKDVTEDADDAAIVRAIIAMARSLKLRVIAEGVETSEQMDFLRDHQCEEIQGYYFSKPVTPEALVEILKRQSVNS